MATTKPVVIVTRKLPEATEMRLKELFDAQLNDDDTPMSRDQLIAAVGAADVLVPTVTDRISAEVIAAAGDRLKLIANYGNGVDNIDLRSAREKGISVTNTPGVLTEDTADMTMALILAVPRRLYEGAQVIRSGDWSGWSPTFLPGHRIWGKRLGIIGMGHIGTAVARRARGFGLKIHYHNRRPVHPDLEAELEATYWDSLDQMLARVDIVSVNCPHTPATFHLLSRRRLELLQPHCYIVNTSRGEVIDERALGDLIAGGRIAGAGLDVFEHEPAVDPRLTAADNVILLPHLGSATIEGRREMGEKVAINIQAFVDGHTPPDRVLETMY
ncbi:MAG: D-glycerate dehydrogenase [Alphaproteobacteria bacterium]|nr:D-glycerate dehydrogenase [Alphaproteobacteria bacterium]